MLSRFNCLNLSAIEAVDFLGLMFETWEGELVSIITIKVKKNCIIYMNRCAFL